MQDDATADMPDLEAEASGATVAPGTAGSTVQSPQNVALAKSIIKTIRDDKEYFKKDFERMHRDMQVATMGHETTWGDVNYSANITGRHVKQKTAALYAKNPKAVWRRKERLDFAIWDENPVTLQLAVQLQQTAAQAAAAAPVLEQVDPATGLVTQVQAPPPQIPGLAEAQALIADVQEGMATRTRVKRLGKTLEILFAQAVRAQQPLDFKSAMKSAVRRTGTTCVGYVELGFQREKGPRPQSVSMLADSRTRLDHLRRLAEEAAEEDRVDMEKEAAELELSIAALQREPELILREGLIFDFPASTKVIPDRMTTALVGFLGARHVAIEYTYTPDEVREIFGVDLGKNYTPYAVDGKRGFAVDSESDLLGLNDAKTRSKELACVWKYYDKPTGLVYLVCDGYDGFLREPVPPDVFVPDFWPLYALVFNDVENEKKLFPPSDVSLLIHMQREYNRSRQGKREHRDAARPRWAYTDGAFEEEEIPNFEKLRPFEAMAIKKDPQTKLADVLEVFPVPGVDPNLYDTGEIFSDMQLAVGAQEAQLGGLAKATATESAIAADSSATADGSSIDDLDAFLSRIALAAGQILLREMSHEQVVKIVGPGAYWPDNMTLADIADEIFLEIEAGSTGKPNQAIEIRNWKEMLPFLLQMGSIPSMWLARESLRRLDDRMDLTEAVVEGIPAIVAQNRMSQPAPGDPGADPAAQGGEGGNNGPQAPGNTGSGPAFGSNQVPG